MNNLKFHFFLQKNIEIMNYLYTIYCLSYQSAKCRLALFLPVRILTGTRGAVVIWRIFLHGGLQPKWHRLSATIATSLSKTRNSIHCTI